MKRPLLVMRKPFLVKRLPSLFVKATSVLPQKEDCLRLTMAQRWLLSFAPGRGLVVCDLTKYGDFGGGAERPVLTSSIVAAAVVTGVDVGDRLDLATIRARKTVVERRSSFAGNNRALVDRGAGVSRDLVHRGVPSGRLETSRGSEPQAHKKTIPSTKVLDSRTANDERGEVRKKIDEEELRHPKKNRTEDLGATSKNSHSRHIFVDGVNHREKADSFWDLNDPEIGWNKGRSIVGDFDMIHLMSQSTDSFAHSLAWNSCQGLSLASAMRVREEKLRNDQNKLREEIVRLKEDNCRLSEEKKNANVELLQAQRKFADKVKDFSVLEEKHSTELKTGGQFLASETGKNFLKSTEDKSVQMFKASPAFCEDVLDQAMIIHDDVVLDCRQQLRKNGVSEEIVMLIEPSVLEVDKVSIDDIPLGDAEMIEALIPRSADYEA